MSDDRLDALLKQMAADEYNRPPEIVPREAMWDAVRVGVNQREPGPEKGEPGVASEPVVRHFPRASRIPRWVYLAAAAVVLLAVGIQVGRLIGPADNRTAQVTPRPADTRDSSGAPRGGDDSARHSAPRDDVAPVGQPDRQLATDARSDDGRPRPRPGPERSAPAEVADNTANAVYTVAAVHHLTEVEAMLTSFKGDLGAGRMDAQLSSWAKDLLSTTRLLIDSPAAVDPLRRKLFQDLELVLVQIIQLSPGAPARDRDLIKGAMTDDQVLMRLRTAIPSGQRGT